MAEKIGALRSWAKENAIPASNVTFTNGTKRVKRKIDK